MIISCGDPGRLECHGSPKSICSTFVRLARWSRRPTTVRAEAAVGPASLTALGVGAIVGTGIFVVVGEAPARAGPAATISFVLAAITCVFSALSYAELASSIPVPGSAFTYAYATLGEIVAWVIGWDLILEYGVSVAAIAVGWGANLNTFLDTTFGVALPERLTTPLPDGGINLPAVVIVLAITFLLIRGVKETATLNNIMVFIKLAVLGLFIVLAFTAFNADNLQPFAPQGSGGILAAAADHLLRLYRLLRGRHRQRRGQEPEAGPSSGDHRIAGHLYDHLHPGLRRRGGNTPGGAARGERRTVVRGARRGRWIALGGVTHGVWRPGGDHQRPASSSCTARRGSSSQWRGTGWCRKSGRTSIRGRERRSS